MSVMSVLPQESYEQKVKSIEHEFMGLQFTWCEIFCPRSQVFDCYYLKKKSNTI